MRICDWSSDVCSADLAPVSRAAGPAGLAILRIGHVGNPSAVGGVMRDVFGLPCCTEDGQSLARPPPAVARTGRVLPRGYPGAGPGRASERFHPVTTTTVAAAGRGYPLSAVVQFLPRITPDLSECTNNKASRNGALVRHHSETRKH